MSIVHVVPVNDLKEHIDDQGIDCWCEPDIRDEGFDNAGHPARVYVHHSLDERELYELQKGNYGWIRSISLGLVLAVGAILVLRFLKAD